MKFTKNEFDIVNKAKPSGTVNEAVDVEIYWFHAIDKSDATFFQSRKMHRHKFFELHFILDGNITYGTQNGKVALKSGEYVLFAPEQSHVIENYSTEMIKCSAAFTVGKEEELYDALIRKCGNAYKISELTEQGIRFVSGISEKQTPYYGLIVKNRLFEIIHDIAGDINRKKNKDTAVGFIDGCDIRIFKAKQFIKDNPHVFLACEDMAAYCDLSVKQLNRLFLKYEKISLLAYIHKEKIAMSKQLLAESDATIREISDDLGFSSVYYFSRFFIKHVNLTPGKYRDALDKSK